MTFQIQNIMQSIIEMIIGMNAMNAHYTNCRTDIDTITQGNCDYECQQAMNKFQNEQY